MGTVEKGFAVTEPKGLGLRHSTAANCYTYRRHRLGYALYFNDDFQRYFAGPDPLHEYVDRQIRNSKMKNRACLCCRKVFVSEGSHNRLCSYCRQKSVGVA